MLCKHVQLPLLLKMIFSAFHKVQWGHFSDVVDRFKNTRRISLGFCVPKIIHIGLFLTGVIQKGGHFFGTQCTYQRTKHMLLQSLLSITHQWYQFCFHVETGGSVRTLLQSVVWPTWSSEFRLAMSLVETLSSGCIELMSLVCSASHSTCRNLSCSSHTYV